MQENEQVRQMKEREKGASGWRMKLRSISGRAARREET